MESTLLTFKPGAALEVIGDGDDLELERGSVVIVKSQADGMVNVLLPGLNENFTVAIDEAEVNPDNFRIVRMDGGDQAEALHLWTGVRLEVIAPIEPVQFIPGVNVLSKLTVGEVQPNGDAELYDAGFHLHLVRFEHLSSQYFRIADPPQQFDPRFRLLLRRLNDAVPTEAWFQVWASHLAIHPQGTVFYLEGEETREHGLVVVLHSAMPGEEARAPIPFPPESVNTDNFEPVERDGKGGFIACATPPGIVI